MVQTFIAMAVLLQALIPLGFMPNAQASTEGTALVICSGLDTKTIYVDASGKPLQHKKSGSESKPCLYSGVATFHPPSVPSLSTAFVIETNRMTAVLLSQFKRDVKNLSNPATGPPVLL